MSIRRRLATASVLVATLIATTATGATAAPGDVTTTTATPPSAVGSATLNAAFNDLNGGAYQVFRSGQTAVLVRADGSGAVDAAFNGGTPVTIGAPTGLASSDNLRINGATSPVTQKWWVVTGAQSPMSLPTTGVVVTSGDAKGTITFTKALDGAALLTKCGALVSGATLLQNPVLYPRRNGGAWLALNCGTPSSTVHSNIFIPLAATGDFDTAAATFSGMSAHGGSASCNLTVTAVADPTSKAPAPELWLTRAEHTFQRNSQCVTNVGNTDSANVASAFVALAALGVKEDGTVTRTQLATTPAMNVSGMRVDPGGRVVLLAGEIVDTTKVHLLRLKSDGTLDNTVGTAGLKALDTGALPTGSAFLRATLTGVVTTNEKVYFAVQLYDTELQTYNNTTTPRVHGFRMGLVSVTDGWVAGYGTGGIGGRVSATLPENWFSRGNVAFAGSTVDNKAQPRNFTFTETATQLNVWAAITGATGGGEGGTGLGGFTKDTGGAPSKGEANSIGGTTGTTTDATTGTATGRIDTKVYATLPSRMQVNTAFTVMTSAASSVQTLASSTRSTCVTTGRHVVAIAVGRCTVTVTRKSDGVILRTLRTTVVRTASTLGSQVTVSDPIQFAQVSAALSKTARAQIAAIAANAASAKAIVVVGHAAALTDSEFNFAISRNRAMAVRGALVAAKVKAPITAVSRGTIEQISTSKTESAQAKNRRVVVYLVP